MQPTTPNFPTEKSGFIQAIHGKLKELCVHRDRNGNETPSEGCNLSLNRIWQLAVLFFLTLGSVQSVHAQSDFVSDPLAPTVEVGTPLSIVIKVDITGGAVDGAEVHLDFDETLLQVTSLTALSSGQLPSVLIPATFDNGAGTIDFAAGVLGAQNSISQDFDFLQVNFSTLGTGSTVISFNTDFPRRTNITGGGVSVLGTAASVPVTINGIDTPPMVSITAPLDGENFVAGSDVLVQVDAVDNIGIVQVELFDDTTSLGVDTTFPYSFALNNIAAGSYNLTAVAADANTTTTSAPVLITVTNPVDNPPLVSITSPAAGSDFPEGTNLTVEVSASDDTAVTQVELFDGTTSLGILTAAPYDFVLNNLSEGSYNLTAVASDANTDTTSDPVNFTVTAADTSPVVTMAATASVSEGGNLNIPLSISDDDGDNLTVTITSVSNEPQLLQSANSGKQVDPFPTTADGFFIENNTANSGGSYISNLDFNPVFGDGGGANGDGNGVYTITVQADDEDGNSISAELTLTVNDVAQPISSTNSTRIEAESFDNQGPGNTSPGNTSDNKGIGVEIDAGFTNIGFTNVGDFMEYEIDVTTAGTYRLDLFVGIPNGSAGSTMDVSSEGNSVGSFTAVGTGGFGSYQTQSLNIILPQGLQTLQFEWTGGSGFLFNMDYFDMTFIPGANTPPSIEAIADIQVDEGNQVNVTIQVNDDNDPSAAIVIYDKSVLGTNNPFTPGTTVTATAYTFTDNGGGSYTLSWPTVDGDGRSYEARITANDGVNTPVEEVFTIDIAQDIPDTILARTFSDPLPWYGGNPQAPFTVSIENETAKNIGWIDPGEFVEYLIDVPSAGVYDVQFFAGKGNGGTLTVTLSEENGGGFAPIGSFGATQTGWQTYVPYEFQVSFANAGVQTLRLDFSGSGGVNIRDFNFTVNSDNQTPVVTITAPADGSAFESGSSLGFTGTANDFEDGDLTAGIVWNSSIDGDFGTGATANGSSLSVGTHIITATATDNDPSPETGTATITVIIGQPAPECDVAFRVNAGGPVYASASGDFEADQSAGNAGGSAQTGTPSGYINLTPPAVDNTFGSPAAISNTTGYPDFLFQTERWSDAANPNNMQWAFPTGNGTFDVDILFNENWSGEIGAPRVFDVEIEGVLQLDDYRPSVDGTQVNVAKVESFQVTVTDGTLNIHFLQGTQNPAVKGFSICTVTPANDSPEVAITTPSNGATITRGQDVTLTGTANDTEDGNIAADLEWTSSDPQFVPTPTDGIGASITGQFVTTGSQTLTASVTDSGGETGEATITINVPGPEVSFAAPAENETINCTTVDVEVTPVNVLFVNTEHFHFYLNPDDPNNLDYDTRISTFSSAPGTINFTFDELSGALAANGSGNGIVEGANTIVVIVAAQDHSEFTNPEARAVVNFTVATPSIVDVNTTDPTDCSTDDGTITITATGNNLEYSIDNGSTFQVGNSFTGLAAGTYDIVVQEVGAANCVVSDTATLTAPQAPSITNVASTDPTDCSVDDGTITITATGTDLEYSINNGSTFQAGNSFTGLAAGTYDIVVQEAGAPNCTGSDTATLTAPATPIIIDVTATDPSDCNVNDGTIIITATGTDLLYSIDDGTNFVANNTFTDLPAGTYGIVVQENGAANCATNDTAILIAPEAPSITNVASTDPTDCNADDGTITITANGTNLQYSIDNGATFQAGNNFIGLAAGTFNIVVQANGAANCTDNDSVALTAPTAPVVASIDFTNLTDCGLNDGTITINATGNDLLFSIDDGLNFQAGNTFDGLSEGIYAIVVQENGTANCTATDTVTLIVEDTTAPVITCPATVTVTSSNGSPVVIENLPTATATDSCDTTPTITGIRSDNAALTDPYPVGQTIITWTAIDDEGNGSQCAQTISVNFTASTGNDIVSFTIPGQVGSTDIDPVNHTVQLLVSFETGLTGLVPAIGVSEFATVNPTSGQAQDFVAPVTYQVTSQSGATQDWEASVSVEPDTTDPTVTCPADITVNNDPGLCGAVVDFMVAELSDDRPGVTASASPAGGSFFPVGTTIVTITALDAAGNTAQCTFDVTVNDTEPPAINCPGDVNVQGGSNGETSLADYTVSATTSDNCPGFTVIQSPAPGTTISGTTEVILTATDTSGLTGNCSFNVTVDPIGPTPSLAITPAFVSINLPEGGTSSVDYIVDSNNGSSLPTPAAMTLVDDDTGLAPTWVATTSAANQGTPYELDFNTAGLAPGTYEATLTAGPVAGYNDASIPVTLMVDAVPTVLSVTSFTLVNASNDQDIVTLNNGDLIDITALPTTNLTIRANTTSDVESVRLVLSGAKNKGQTENVAPYALYGDNAGNYAGSTFILGNYTITASPYSGGNLGGTLGTPLTVSFQLVDEDPACANFDASIVTSNPTTCAGNQGTATVTASGATAPVTYSWSHNSNLNSSAVTGLIKGTYNVTVTDANQCSKILSFTLTDPPWPNVNLASFASVLVTDPAFSLGGGSPTGGNFSGVGVSSNVFTPSTAGLGTHAITYTYTNPTTGCTSSAVKNITVNSPTSNAALVVLDANTDQPLFALTDGLVVQKGNVPWGIIYNPSLNPKGIFFRLTGPINHTQAEGSSAPFSVFGDIGINVQGRDFPVGTYRLVGNPSSGATVTVNFTVIDGPPGNQSPTAVASGTVDPSVPFKINFTGAASTDNDGSIVEYSWNFGDSNTFVSSQPTTSHTYISGGNKTVTLTVKDNLGATNGANIVVNPIDPNDIDRVESFTLINPADDTDRFDLSNGDIINANDLAGVGINIRANTLPREVGSVKFVLTGTASRNWTESFAPYALFGDLGGVPPDYDQGTLPNGSYTLTATPYSSAGGNGIAGTPLTVQFSIVQQTSTAKTVINTMKITPNPADRNTTLVFDSPAPLKDVLIYDVTGKLIKQMKADDSRDVGEYLLQVQDLPTGTYFVRIRDAKGVEFQQQMAIKR